MLIPPEDSQHRQKLKAALPQTALAHFQFWQRARPAAVDEPDGRDEDDVLPLPTGGLEGQQAEVTAQVGQRRAAVVGQATQARVGREVPGRAIPASRRAAGNTGGRR